MLTRGRKGKTTAHKSTVSTKSKYVGIAERSMNAQKGSCLYDNGSEVLGTEIWLFAWGVVCAKLLMQELEACSLWYCMAGAWMSAVSLVVWKIWLFVLTSATSMGVPEANSLDDCNATSWKEPTGLSGHWIKEIRMETNVASRERRWPTAGAEIRRITRSFE
jgi:hypothetical protein